MRVFVIGVVSSVMVMSVAAATRQSDPPPGKAPFTRVCSGCHGPNAEGAQGPKIAGIELEYDDFLAKVRHSGGEMPSFSKNQISDDEVKAVFDYLKSL